MTRLEERVGTYEAFEREYENRGFELANLLETLKRFDVDVGSVCQLAAEGKYILSGTFRFHRLSRMYPFLAQL